MGCDLLSKCVLWILTILNVIPEGGEYLLWFAFKMCSLNINDTINDLIDSKDKLWFAFKMCSLNINDTAISEIPIIYVVVICFQNVFFEY